MDTLRLYAIDLSLKHKTWVLRVEQIIGMVRGRLFFGSPNSEASKRTVGLLYYVAEALKVPRENIIEDQLIFRTRNGTLISPRNLLRHFHQILEKQGIRRGGFHSLRHTFVTLLLARNIPPQDVQAIASHLSFGITVNTYGRLMQVTSRKP